MLITLSGVDCVGKTTQIARLEAHLAGAGHRPHVFWHRPGYSKELDALRSLARRLRPQALPRVEVAPERREAVFRKPSVRRTWLVLAVADSLVQYALKVRALLAAGRTVICDRYIDDARLDLSLRFPELAAVSEAALSIVERAAPTPDLAILLTLDRDEILRRIASKQEPFPDPPEIREMRLSAYGEMAARGRFTVVDASPDIETVGGRIVALVEGRTREMA